MTPNFAAAVDPIFLHVLGLLDRIGHNESPSPTEERVVINNWLRNAEAQLGQKQEWELAKYALVAWIDDVLIEAPWTGKNWWKENALEVEAFNTRDRATVFYARSQEAAKLSRRDALEVFYVCVVLGFRGLYRDSAAAFLADQLGLPPTLDAWASQVSKSIQLGQGRPTISEAPRPGSGAPPLEGKYRLTGTVLLGVALAAVAAVTWLVLFSAESGPTAPNGSGGSVHLPAVSHIAEGATA